MRLSTRLRSLAMRILASERLLKRRRQSARRQRQRQGKAPEILYFHQADDPYSFIMVQQLQRFAPYTTLPITPYLVSGPDQAFQGDAQRFSAWALEDAASIASFLGEPLPAPAGESQPTRPDAKQVAMANGVLSSALLNPDFLHIAHQLGQKLWRQELSAAATDQAATAAALAQGNNLQGTLGHYLGAALYYDGEWFWGADRLPRLWDRLDAEGFTVTERGPYDPYAGGARQRLTTGPAAPARQVTLEYFPSLRSPYTAIAHESVSELAARTGVELSLRPVMPMLMRGIPAPRAKQFYIISDCTREAKAKGVPFGNFVDPFGEPVKRGFRLFPGALAQGKGMAFIGSYLSAAFAEGVDIDSEQGLNQVVSRAGLDWHSTANHPDNDHWAEVLEENLQAMLDAGLWGVPSFRISSPDEADFCCWGQDRIWRVEQEILRRQGGISKE